MKIKQVKLSEITPYQNNPFKHTEEELNRVKKSIQNNSYLVPIILDKNNVIIAGHLRYKALCELNDTETPISVIDASHLTEEQANKFRILENQRPEIDFTAMQIELEANIGDQVRAVYNFQAQRNSKVFGIFNARMQVQAQVDAESGEVLQVNKPWWAFLAVEPEE